MSPRRFALVVAVVLVCACGGSTHAGGGTRSETTPSPAVDPATAAYFGDLSRALSLATADMSGYDANCGELLKLNGCVTWANVDEKNVRAGLAILLAAKPPAAKAAANQLLIAATRQNLVEEDAMIIACQSGNADHARAAIDDFQASIPDAHLWTDLDPDLTPPA